MHRKKIIIVAASLLALYAITGFFILPAIVKPRLQEAISENTKCPVLIGGVKINPFALSVTVEDFSLLDRDSNKMVSFKELYINFEIVSIFRRAYVFADIHLSSPDIFIGIRQNGSTNLADAMHPDSSKADTSEKPPMAVVVYDLEIDSGRVVFEDRARPVIYRSEFDSLGLSLKDFTTLPDETGEYRFEASTGRNEIIRWKGNFSVVPLRSSGTLELVNVRVRTFWEYIQHLVNFDAFTGLADIRGDYKLDMSKHTTVFTLRNGLVSTRGLVISSKLDSVNAVSLPELSISGIQMDYPDHNIEIASISAKGAALLNVMHQDTSMTLKNMFLPKLPPGAAPPPKSPMAWKILMRSIELSAISLHQEDRTTTPYAALDLTSTDLTIENFRLDKPAPAGILLKTTINKSGTAVATGSVTLDIDNVSVAADADAEISNIALTPFQPYVNPYAKMDLKSGTVGYRGKIRYAYRDAKQAMEYDGDVGFENVVVTDRVLQEDFLRFGKLDLKKLSFSQSKRSVSINEIVARQPYLRFIIGPDRISNIQNMMGSDSAAVDSLAELASKHAPSAHDSVPPMKSRIKQIRVVDGSMNFSDHSLKPNFNVGVQEMGGTIKGLSSEQVSRADVDLEGKVDKYAPAIISGQINPLSEEAFTDITMSFHGIELTTFNPYSNRFAGYKIDKGKLNVDLHYKLNKTYIEAENKIVISQLTLGEKVESPDATSLPVKLAIALLKDSHGVIDLDIPVEGDINDPQFSVMPIVLKALLNLVVKAVTAPFKLLGSLFGGSDTDLSYIEFSPGSDSVNMNEEKKLASLAKALKERPELSLDVRGIVVDTLDREALAERVIFSKIQPAAAINRDVARLTDGQRSSVRSQYKETFKEDAKTLVPRPSEKDKEVSDEEYELLVTKAALVRLIRSYTVMDDALTALAHQRADAVKTYLVLKNGIDEARVFLTEVNLKAEMKEGAVQMELTLQAR